MNSEVGLDEFYLRNFHYAPSAGLGSKEIVKTETMEGHKI